MKPGLPINGDMISRFRAPLGGGVRRRVDVLERAEVSRMCREGRFLYARVSMHPADTLRYKEGPCRRTRLVAALAGIPCMGDGGPRRARRSCVHRVGIEACPPEKRSAPVDHCRAAHWRFAGSDSFPPPDTPHRTALQSTRREPVGAQPSTSQRRRSLSVEITRLLPIDI